MLAERWVRNPDLRWRTASLLITSLKTRWDVLAHDPEPSRAPNHLPSRHDDGAATAELHEVDFLIGGTEQHEVRDPKVEHQRPLHAFLQLSRSPPPSAFESRRIGKTGWLLYGLGGNGHDARLFLARITWSRSDRLSRDGLSNLDHGG